MKNFTFKKQLTASEDLVQGLAQFKGYMTNISIIEPGQEPSVIPNPESPVAFIDRLLDEHIKAFYVPFGQTLVKVELDKLGIDEQKRQAQEQIENVIIKPVNDALTGEIIES